MSDRVKNLLNELKYDKRMLLAENKQLKASYSRNGSQLVEVEINELWKELKQLKKDTLRQMESTRKKMKAAYTVLCVSWMFFSLFCFYKLVVCSM